MSGHSCPGRLCGGRAEVRASMLMCRQDWYATPKTLRDQVWAAWDGGRGQGSPEHRDAIAAAIAANQGGESR